MYEHEKRLRSEEAPVIEEPSVKTAEEAPVIEEPFVKTAGEDGSEEIPKEKTDSAIPVDSEPEKKAEPRQEEPAAAETKRPVLCFVIDDVGNNLEDLERFLRVPGKVTFAVLPGLPASTEAAERVKAAGQELLLHQPMEAIGGVYPGPGLLTESMNGEERLACLESNLKSVPGAVGVNNHMGSKGTSSLELSSWLLETLKEKNLFFLDSRTTADSRIREAAGALNFIVLERNSMFLDNEKDIESLKFAVEAGKATAREKGHAVMIGHAVTSELADLMMHYYPSLIEEGFVIENLTYLLNEARKNDESAGN